MMHYFFQNFELRVQELAVALQCVVFALLVIGLIIHLSRQHYHMASIVRPVGRALTIVGLVASMGWWFPKAENTLLAVAEFIDADYIKKPMQTANIIREGLTPNPAEGSKLSLRRIGQALFNAFIDAGVWILIFISTILTIPMYIMQYIIKWVLYLLTPMALACFMIPTLQGLAVRFFQQLMAILSWPVGFAITNFVAGSLWREFHNTVGPEATLYGMAFMQNAISNVGGLLAGLTLIIGTICTPVFCQKLFASGQVFTGTAGSPATIARTVMGVHSQMGAFAARAAAAKATGGASLAALPPPPPSATPSI